MLGKDHALLERIQEMRKDELVRQEEREPAKAPVRCPLVSRRSKCGECIHCASVWKLRCELSTEDSRACNEIERKASFMEGDSHGI